MVTTNTLNTSRGSDLSTVAQVWLYQRAEPRCWTVGYFDPAGQWQRE